MIRDPLSGQELLFQAVQLFVEGLAVIRKLVRIEIQVQVQPALFPERVTFIGAFLFKVPGDRLAEDIQLEIAVVVLVEVFLITDLTYILLCE